ncbi:MAG: serine/threonine protein kinase [Gammaproteobacteria bacterium]|nr:MAG: serine/threonine protein kinase [Gammaproteobacteria bacterium]
MSDTDNQPVDYSNLTPDTVLSAAASVGYDVDASIIPLNSYENRVYQIGIHDSAPIITKFYRPERWSNEAILEEHAFSIELADLEVPVIPPLPNANNQTLHTYNGYRFAVFTKQAGRSPETDNMDHLYRIGRFIGRIHAVGATRQFMHRSTIEIQNYGQDSLNFLLNNDFIPNELTESYISTAEIVLDKVKSIFDNYHYNLAIKQRIHGDCHIGNILWREEGPHFVDLDDCITGPAVQDIWMLLSGDRAEMTTQLSEILDGYNEFNNFIPTQLVFIEPLRALRLLHYSAWLAKRWSDPAFPHNFPWFNTVKYWQDQILILREQIALLDEEPLFWR